MLEGEYLLTAEWNILSILGLKGTFLIVSRKKHFSFCVLGLNCNQVPGVLTT